MRLNDYEKHLGDEMLAGRLSRRSFLIRASVAGLSIPTIGAVLAACGNSSESAPSDGGTAAGGPPKAGGTLNVGLVTPSSQVDPVFMIDVGAVDTVMMVGEYLCFPDADLTLRPRLATSWKAQDAKTWTFTLREGVKFHNGQPMTAADVVATFDLITDPATNSAASQSLGGVLSKGNTEKVDDHTVTFHLDRPYADFPYLVSAFGYNTVILPKGYTPGEFTSKPVGTGPYMFKSYTPQVRASLVKNPNYWQPGRPYVDALNISYFADPNAQILALQSGSIDLIPSVEPSALRAIKGNSSIVQLPAGSSSFQSMQMRTDSGPLADKRIRQALALSLDRGALISTLMNGKGTVANDHLFAPIFPVSEPVAKTIVQRKRDIEQAKTLLAAAGHPNGLSVELTTARLFECVDHATLIKQMAKDAGFDITLNILTPDAYFASGSNSPWLNSPLAITNWGSRGSASQIIEATVLTSSTSNSAHYANPTLDELVKTFDAELDQDKRAGIGTKIATILNDDVPLGISYFKNQVRVTAAKVHGAPAGPGDYPDLTNVWIS
ncbi:ABC transporter substrate-binding protein [Dactylosporangium sp. CA-233914]|uniref:ABC transporter substrate-binding protein n=1 Tax=Dactylosporangium sp. CA-233914 TaxID=3239934 RepID=UPI003D8A573F